MEPRIQYATAPDGAKIAFWQVGDSTDVVVLIPSLGRSGCDFDDLAATLASAGFRAVPLDPRGVGASSAAPLAPTLHNLATDVAAIVETLACGAVHVIGHAFGNRVARCFASDYPGLVRSVTLLAAGGLVAPEPEVRGTMMKILRTDLPEHERLAALRIAFFAAASDPSVWLDGWWPDAAMAQAVASRATPLEDWWGAGDAPVLVVQGLEDRSAPPANGYALHDRFPKRVRVVDIPNAGHALLPEQPEAIAEAVIPFLRGESDKNDV